MEIAAIPLIAGHPALDFVNAGESFGTPAEVNYLPDFAALLAWAARVGLVDADRAARLAASAARNPEKTQRAWSKAMQLRNDLDGLFRAIALKKPPPPAALAGLNAMLARAQSHRHLAHRYPSASKADDIAWVWDDDSRLGLIGWEIAMAAGALITHADKRARIRICDDPECPWMFLDESRTGKRRWCRMNVCGNAAKASRFRERQKAAHQHG